MQELRGRIAQLEAEVKLLQGRTSNGRKQSTAQEGDEYSDGPRPSSKPVLMVLITILLSLFAYRYAEGTPQGEVCVREWERDVWSSLGLGT